MHGSHWVSMPFNIKEDGFYALSVVKTGAGVWDILIDGEKYDQFKNISLKIDRENIITFLLYILKGQHSIIFRSAENIDTSNGWSLLRIQKLQNVPDRYIDTSTHWVPLNTYSRMLEIGEMFSGNYINVNIARDMAIFTSGGYQFISYYNPEGYLVVGRRKLNSDYFEKYWIPIAAGKVPLSDIPSADFSLSDPHYFISMQIDGEGYIHLAFGHHNNKLKYVRSSYPYEVSKWNVPEGAMEDASEEKNVTYVSFIRLNSGNLLSMFRIGGIGKSYYRLLSYDINTRKWSRIYSPFITDYSYSTPYFWRPVVTKDGTIHLLWTWRLSKFNVEEAWQMLSRFFSGFPNKDIMYAKSLDEGKTWLRSDGSAYGMPIDRRGAGKTRAEIIKTVPLGQSFFNHYGSDYDSKGYPHFTYTQLGDAVNRIPQQWHIYWNGTSWKTDSATKYHQRFDWTRAQQDGFASTYLVRPSILIANDDTAIIISRSREFNNKIELYMAVAPYYKNWTRLVGYEGNLGGWEPQMDLDRWHLENKLDLLLIGITDKEAVKFSYNESRKKKMSRMLSRFNFWLQAICKKEPLEVFAYYSGKGGVGLLETDRNLKENTGYLLEIDYAKMKGAVNIQE